MNRVISGVGVGLRTPHIHTILEQQPAIPWFELLTENWLDASGIDGYLLDTIVQHYPVALHGVAMNLGGVQPLNQDYLQQLKQLARRCQTQWVSDHLCFSAADGIQLHDLLPLPRTEETLKHLVRRIDQVQTFLQLRISIENISAYVSHEQNQYTEAEFMNQIAARTGCGILLDVNNLYVNQHNLQESAEQYIAALQPQFVTQYHLGGYTDKGSYLLDAHNQPVSEPVWQLFGLAVEKIGSKPSLIEWDNDLPEFSTLFEQKQLADRVLEEVRAGTVSV